MNAHLEQSAQTQGQQEGGSVTAPPAPIGAPAHLMDGNRLNWAALLHEALTEPGRLSAAFSVFHRYSVGNGFLLMLQATLRGVELSPVASFKKWKELGRSVRKGEKAYEMVMPVQVNAKPKAQKGENKAEEAEQIDETTGKRTVFMFRRNWFLFSQTEPTPGAEQIAPEAPRALEWDRAQALAALNIAEESYSMADGNCQGYAYRSTIAINPLAALPIKTTFHEMAHILLGHTRGEARMLDGATLARSVQEGEAESVAYLCCASLGLPGAEESRGYIQNWLRDEAQYFESRSAARVFAVANKILKAGAPVEASQESNADEA